MRRSLVACLLATAMLAPGAPRAADTRVSAGSTGDATASAARQGDAKKPEAKKPDAKKDDAKKDDANEKPACMHCGATCDLEPICVCEPGTKKRPRIEFETSSEPICIPACGSLWPCSGRNPRAGCTTCCDEPCACRGRVRTCRKLDKKTVDEEVPTVVRKVRYVCDACAGRGAAGCCDVGTPRRSPSWWTTLTWWWPR